MAVTLSQSDLASLRANLKQRESSGNYQAVNQLGYAGAYQFGAASLVDLGYIDRGRYQAFRASKNWDQKDFLNDPANWTDKQPGGLPGFLNNQAAQDQAFDQLTQRNLTTLERTGVVDETTSAADVNGYLATSHLLGPGGARDLANGRAGADANGTSAREYFELGRQSTTGASGFTEPPAELGDRQEAILGIPDGATISDDGRQYIDPETGAIVDIPPPVEEQWRYVDNQQGAQQGATGGGPVTGSGAFAQSLDVITIDPKPNPLSDLASSTYQISLYMMGINGYVDLMTKTGSSPLEVVNKTPKVLIARSGGLGFDQSKEFDIDFFIDNLQVQNVGSPNKSGANTNATDIKFDLYEPRGITLVERLKRESDALGEDTNYINTPYLLEIKFKGYNDEGVEVNTQLTPRYIPIKIVGLKFSITASGAAYKCEAVPFHQNIFGAVNNTIPLNVQVSAKNVGDVFANSVDLLDAETVSDDEAAAREAISGVTGRGRTDGERTIYKKSGASARNLASAITEFNKKTTQPKPNAAPEAEYSDRVDFLPGGPIFDAKLVQEFFDALNTDMKDAGDAFKTYASAVAGKIDMDSETGMFRINAGTSIVALINFIVIASDYMNRNVAKDGERTRPGGPTTPIFWWKIKPKILGVSPWDKKAGRYKFHVRYDVLPSTLFYSDYPWAPLSKPNGKGYHKEYSYIFTGENTEILSMKLDFNTAYYQVQTFGTGSPDDVLNDAKSNFIAQKKVNTEGGSNSNNVQNQELTLADKRGKDLVSSIMTDGADLVEMKMTILGDPDLIPTGDGFFQGDEIAGNLYTDAYWPDGTINYDLSAPHVNIKLKTPTEYNDNTGLLDPNEDKRYGSSAFSGIYRIIEVKSTFSGGVFTQDLNMIRAREQPDENGLMRGQTFADAFDTGEIPPASNPTSDANADVSAISGDPTLDESSLGESPPPSLVDNLVNELNASVASEAARIDWGETYAGAGEFGTEPVLERGFLGYNTVDNTKSTTEALGNINERIDQNNDSIAATTASIERLEAEIAANPDDPNNNIRQNTLQALRDQNANLRAENTQLNQATVEAMGYPTTGEQLSAEVTNIANAAGDFFGSQTPKPNDQDPAVIARNPDLSAAKVQLVQEYENTIVAEQVDGNTTGGVNAQNEIRKQQLEAEIKRIDPDWNPDDHKPDVEYLSTSSNPNRDFQPTERANKYDIIKSKQQAQREILAAESRGQKLTLKKRPDGTFYAGEITVLDIAPGSSTGSQDVL